MTALVAVIHVLGWAAAALGAVGCAYALAAALFVGRLAGRPAGRADSPPDATLLKPLHGDEPGLADNLESFLAQDYPSQVQLVAGVQDPADPAIGVVRALQAAHPGQDVELVVDAAEHGANRKISNVVNIAARAKHPLLVLSDSDIRVGPHYLAAVAAALAEPGAGAVTCLYVGRPAAGLWSQLAAMAISYNFLPNAALGSSIGMAQPCFGSTIAMTADTLARIGGYGAFAGHLADDYEIGRAVRALGLRVAIPPLAVEHLCAEASLGELIEHELRWGLTIRLIDTAGYAGSVVTHPLPFALIALALTGLAPAAMCLVLAALLARLVLKLQVDARCGARSGPWYLLPLRDMLSFGVFLASFLTRTVGWRGRRFDVRPDGLLTGS
ncbi:MAG TPA: bacteriohopanetetrol glucosamine biosynthesis glycosyltransferase HpnI [Caulobacteraceae bacterium]|nr:bacteriohopanetetrol glucosamine biosynthesis glycosyltransferase HpnI [Caulobacteraceae bacterium]